MPDTSPFILDVKLVFNGKEFPMRQSADLEKMKEVLSVLERVFELFGGSERESTPSTAQARHEHQVTPTPVIKSHTDASTHARSVFKKALMAINRPATIDEILKQAFKAGFQSTRPVKLLRRAVRENPYFEVIGRNPNGGNLFWLAGLKIASDIDRRKTETLPPGSPPPTETPVGARLTIEYAMEVLEEAQQEMTSEQLGEKMLAIGWQTLSDTPEKRGKSVHAALWRHQDIFRFTHSNPMAKGLWGLKKWQSENPLLGFDTEPEDEEDYTDNPL